MSPGAGRQRRLSPQMRSLLLRLSALDTDAATAVRVIDFFDALVERRASVEALVRATGGLAECACGMQLADGRQWRFAPTGEALSGDPHTMSGQVDFEVDKVAGTLWLEREGARGPMDDLVLERASLAARILLTDHRPRRVAGVVDASLMEVALSTHESLADRSRVLRQLGLIPDQPVRVAALSVSVGRDPAVEAVTLERPRTTRAIGLCCRRRRCRRGGVPTKGHMRIPCARPARCAAGPQSRTAPAQRCQHRDRRKGRRHRRSKILAAGASGVEVRTTRRHLPVGGRSR